MEPEPLTDLMMREHRRLEEMLENVSLMVNEHPDKVAEAFNTFKWNMEKHLVIEEKAIFHIEGLSGTELNDTFKLMQDHGVIMGLMKKIEQSIKNKDFSEIEKLIEILDEHANFEDQGFYPNLDKKLSADRKKEILERVNEILKG